MSVKTFDSVLGVRKITVTTLRNDDPYADCVDIYLEGEFNDLQLGGTFTPNVVTALINELAAAIGRDVTLSEPKPALPTKPGIYVSGDMGKSDRLESAQIYKLKESGWTNADGAAVDIWRVEEVANLAGGLVRLTPEEAQS